MLDRSRQAPAAEPLNELVNEPLDERALLALQLLARGYTPAQIAGMRELSTGDVLRDLARAFRHLDAGTAREAIAAARRRGLIL